MSEVVKTFHLKQQFWEKQGGVSAKRLSDIKGLGTNKNITEFLSGLNEVR